MKLQELTQKVIGAAIDVHKELGPGLLESSYHQCMAHAFALQKISFTSEAIITIPFKGIVINAPYRADFIIERQLVVEIKSVEHLTRLNYAQTLTYLKHAKLPVALLINFNVIRLKYGIKRFVN